MAHGTRLRTGRGIITPEGSNPSSSDVFLLLVIRPTLLFSNSNGIYYRIAKIPPTVGIGGRGLKTFHFPLHAFEGNCILFNTHDAPIGYSHSVSIPAQVFNNTSSIFKWWLTVNNVVQE